MQNSTVDISGFDDLFKTMDALALEFGKQKTDRIWKRAMGAAMVPVLQSVKENAPQDTGQLKEHIYLKTHRATTRDKASGSYRGETFITRVTVSARRDDSDKHTTITSKGKERVTYTNRPVALAMEFGTAEVSARPFIRAGLESNIDRVITIFGYKLQELIETGPWTKGKGKK